jgi:proline dehydrogenase
MGIARRLLLRGSESRWLADQFARRAFARRAVTRFMPGEELSAALEAADKLRGGGISTILTLLGENVEEGEQATLVVNEFLDALDRIEERKLDAYLSLKPTHCGLDLGFQAAYENLRTLIGRSAERGRPVVIDMESSQYLEATLDLYRRLRAAHANVGVCIQSYLYRSAGDLDSLLSLEPMIRLVKGAYKEPAEVAYPSKRDVDANFLRLADRLLDAVARGRQVRVAFGTHDLRLIAEVNRRAAAMGVAPDAYEIQMLYGIQREAQRQLATAGYRMRVLISYGEQWFPWYMRRLAERPANVLFVLRNLIAH